MKHIRTFSFETLKTAPIKRIIVDVDTGASLAYTSLLKVCWKGVCSIFLRPVDQQKQQLVGRVYSMSYTVRSGVSILTLFRMGLFGAVHGWGGRAIKFPIPMNHLTHPLSSTDISIFSQWISKFCYYQVFFNKHGNNFFDVNKNGYSRPS